MEEKLFYDYIDIMNMFGVGATRAYGILRSIKLVSDSLRIKGKVTVADFDKWYNMPRQEIKKESIPVAAGTHCN